jgi:hypothetical protein
MKLDDLLKNVAPRWHEEFLHFIETGDAGDDFLEYLNNDPEGQQAVEMAFNAQAQAFEGLAEELKKGPVEPAEAAMAASDEPAMAASDRMAEALEVVVQLSPERRKAALERTASVLGASLRPAHHGTALSAVQTLERELAVADHT